MSQRFAFPIKVAVFTAGSLSLPTIAYLHGEKILAGIIVGRRQQAGFTIDAQFVDELNRVGLPHVMLHDGGIEQVIEQLVAWEANIGLVLGISDILPPALANVFAYGAYNVHASLLPQYRGPMPLYWQIRNQESATAITLHHITEDVDGGEIVIQQPLPIHQRDTLYSLAAKVAESAPAATHSLLDSIQQTKGVPAGWSQVGEVSHARWPNQEDVVVDWLTMEAAQIAALARAGNPAFGATVFMRKQPITLLQATAVDHARYGTPAGTVLHIGEPEGLIVATSDSALRLDVLSTAEGVFGGVAFAERFGLDAGLSFGAASDR